jgi:hypothetical protein
MFRTLQLTAYVRLCTDGITLSDDTVGSNNGFASPPGNYTEANETSNTTKG